MKGSAGPGSAAGRVACVLLACAGLARSDDAAPSPTRFTIRSEFGDESAWVEEYLHRATRVLVRMFDAPDVAPPKEISVELKKDPKSQGLGGWASPVALGFTSNVWPDEPWRHWILVHELLNLYAAHYGGAGGYPSDWWSNGRSPFPSYACCLVLAQLGLIEDAAWLKGTAKGKRDHDLYWALHRRHGFELFASFFRLIRADGIDLGKIGAPWPRADERRSLYAVAYLSLAAGESLAPILREHGVGTKPSDWDSIHPDKPFAEYEVTAAEVDALLAVRKRLFGPPAPAPSKHLEADRAKYRSGDLSGIVSDTK